MNTDASIKPMTKRFIRKLFFVVLVGMLICGFGIFAHWYYSPLFFSDTIVMSNGAQNEALTMELQFHRSFLKNTSITGRIYFRDHWYESYPVADNRSFAEKLEDKRNNILIVGHFQKAGGNWYEPLTLTICCYEPPVPVTIDLHEKGTGLWCADLTGTEFPDWLRS